MENMAGCDFCVSAKGLGPHRTRGLYLSHAEWQTTNVTYNGLSQEAKLSSLRKKIFKQLNSDAHKKAKEIMNQQKKNSRCYEQQREFSALQAIT